MCAALAGHAYTGIDTNPEYLELTRRRLEEISCEVRLPELDTVSVSPDATRGEPLTAQAG
jgi:hypothetical protein